MDKGTTRRERLQLILTALIPAALALLGRNAGRLGALAPVLALPGGLALCWAWRELGQLGPGLDRAFGTVLGKLGRLAYLAWGLVLLAGSAGRYAQRVELLLPGSRWAALATALALCLWLGRTGGVLARSGRMFFLASAAALGFALALALPGVDWRNLWPPEGADWAALPAGALECLSLSAYGAYALCLPRRVEGRTRGWPWAAWGCAVLAALFFVTAGTFGPALAASLDDPFLLLLQGVQAPGAFRRGEAALMAALTLADFTLLALLVRGCAALWEELAPPRLAPVGAALAAGAILAAGLAPVPDRWIPAGNLAFGGAVPILAVLLGRARRAAIFSGEKAKTEEDVGEKANGKKT